jgi:trehalose 6-phosphate synthase/phosphatase
MWLVLASAPAVVFAAMSSEEQLCTVEFKLFHNAEDHVRISIVGESHLMGFWDPANGKPMRLASSGCWTASISLPQSQKVVFKFVVLEGDQARWESGKNRELFPRGSCMTFESLTASFLSASVPLETCHRANLFDIAPPHVRLLVASFRLPFQCTQTKAADGSIVRKWEAFQRHLHEDGSEEQLYIINKMQHLQRSVIYIGWPGIDVPKHQEAEVTEELRLLNCVPVFLKSKQLQHFNAFFMGALNPILHSVLTLSVDFARHFTGDGWKSFLEVNMAFKKTVIEVFGETDYGVTCMPDIIFIMGAQLLMLPKLLARSWGKEHVSVPVCMALDCPIPSSDIFRNLPTRTAILESLLSADLISFQSYDYLRHFTYACSRLLGYELQSFQGGVLQLVKQKLRPTFISTLHVGLDVPNIEHLLKIMPFCHASEVIGKELGAASRDAVAACDHLFVGYDELLPTSGAVQKFMGFMKFLELQQQTVSKQCVLVQVLYPGGHATDSFKTEVERAAALVNEKFPYSVLLIFKKLPFNDRACLFRSATCFVKTSLREGLTLIPFEFVLANAVHGAVIFAEFMACSRTFPAAIRVNPFNVEEISQALDRVVSLSQEESRSHHALRHAFVQSRTVIDWARQVLSDTIFASNNSGSFVVQKQIFDLPKPLNTHEVGVAMAGSKHLFMIIEHDLIRDCFSVIRQHLAHLSHHPNIEIYVFSHLGMSNLQEFYTSCPQLGLISDDGHFVKYCKSSEIALSSAHDNDGASYVWRDMAEELMMQFSERTSGTKVVSSDYCCTWVFAKADPEFGVMQAKELTNHLESMIAEFQGAHIVIRRGANYIKVHLEGDSIEDAVRGILSRAQCGQKAFSDTVCIGLGGKNSDERLFEYLEECKSDFSAIFGASLNGTAEYVLVEEDLVDYFKTLSESDALGKVVYYYTGAGSAWPHVSPPTPKSPGLSSKSNLVENEE